MKITDIEIEQFGVWRQLTLPLSGDGPHVFYGPNEAGKTTLKRFLRAMLFGQGWPGAESSPSLNGHAAIGGRLPMGGGGAAGGSLRFTHEGKHYQLKRSSKKTEFDRFELSDSHGQTLPAQRIADMLSGTSEAVFDRLFSIDLFELQELSRLDHDELSGHVYGLSLGEDGRRLLRAVEDLRQYKKQLCSADGRRGRLPRLAAEEDAILARMKSLPNLPALRAELLNQQTRIDADVETWKRRRTDAENDLRARRHLERIHPLWLRTRECHAKLARFSTILDLPPDGLEQLDAIDRQSRTLKRDRDESSRQADESHRRAAALGEEPAIVRAEPAVRAVLGMRSWVAEMQNSRDAAPETEPAEPMTSKSLAGAELGAEWTPDRLARVDTAPAAQLKLTDAARQFQLATGRLSELRKRYRKNRKALQRREQSVEGRLTALGTTPDAAAAALRRELSSAEKGAELRAAEAALARERGSARHHSEHLAEAFEIPSWVTAVLAIFAIGGAIFAVLGLITGVTSSAIAGAAYLLLGLTSGSLAVKLQSHFESALAETADHATDQRQDDEVELRKIRQEMHRLGVTAHDPNTKSDWPSPPGTVLANSGGLAETIHASVKKFGDLDDLVSAQARIKSRRKELTRLRERLRTVQQEVETARQQWCDTLTRTGLPESLEIDPSLETWQNIAHAHRQRASRAPAAAKQNTRPSETGLATFGNELEQMGRRLGIWNGPAGKPLAILNDFESQLDRAMRTAKQRRRLEEEGQRYSDKARQCEQRLAELGQQQTAILAAAGVKSRDDYQQQLQSAATREEHRQSLYVAERELEAAAAAEPDLALVEHDLESFREQSNRDDIHRLVREREELEAKLESAHQRRGQILRQLEELEADRRAIDLGQNKSRIESIIWRTSTRLLSASLAYEAAEDARVRYEQQRQPAVLAAASDILARLTRGRYRRIFSPLDQRTLRVDNDRGHTFAIESLSGGTREQLLLALRLGMVQRAAEQGVELPLILDDVFVNFDQLRTEAAFETLQELAESGRQILLFTCHLHLANLAEQRGTAPIWLPAHERPEPQRLAG